MSIFRRDKDKPNKENKNRHEEVVPAPVEEPAEDEYTDISEAAYDSSSQPLDNKMEEIYSTRDKHVKFRRQQPLEAEAAAKRKEAAKDDLIRGKLEFSSVEEETPEVKLEAELDPNAIVAEEIIEDVVDIKKLRNIYVQDIDDIDVSLDPMESLHAYEKQAQNTERRDARKAVQQEPYVPSGNAVVEKVPVYQHEDSVDKLYLKAGRFTDVVESEYDEYLKSTDPTISKNYHATKPMVKPHQSLLYTLSQVAARRKSESEQKQKSKEIMRNNFDEEAPKPKQKQKKKKRSRFTKFFRVLGAVITSGFTAPSEDEQERSMDYNNREDENYIAERTRQNIKRQAIHLSLYLLIGIALLGLAIWERTSGAAAVAANGGGAAFTCCGLNLILTFTLGLVARHTLIDGLKPLGKLKSNCSTVLSLACIACLLQSLVSLFTCTSFVGGDHHLYSFIAAFALALHTLGRLLMALRVKTNLSFISEHSPAYAAKIYDDDETARRLVSGTTASKGIVAYQHVTRFLSDFLKISYAPDPSEELTGKMAPIAVICSVIVTILYAIIFKSVQGAVSALTVMLCVSIPFTGMLAGNLPLLLFSRRMLKEDAMIAGYPSVRQFCDTTAVMMSASDLFPAGCVTLKELIPLQQHRLDNSLLMAAAVLREAESPIAHAFDELVAENNGVLPSIESVMYEDKSGLVGWIGGERVLIGNMKLMNRYHITVPTDVIPSKRKGSALETAYVAIAGQAVAVLGLLYTPAKIIKEQIRRAERSGLAMVVSTTDANITAELISDRYEIFFRSVKVTAPGYSNVIDEATGRVEETSRAYVATRGRIGSLARAVGGCIGIKTNISLGIVIEIFGMILGILLCATLALYASVSRLSFVELIIYIGFWTAATIIAELIKRP